MEITLFTECVFEFIGTMILLLMGDGVCAACTLEKSKAKGAGWIVISLAWGFAAVCVDPSISVSLLNAVLEVKLWTLSEPATNAT